MFNIPTQITQGDLITWSQELEGYNPVTDTLSCFIRGQSAVLDLNGDGWDFEITSAQSANLTPGAYKTQFVIFSGSDRTTLGHTDLLVCLSFENLTEFDTRDSNEKELEAITKAIAQLSNGVAEYYIGDRRVRYQDLGELSKRQRELRNRIAMAKNPGIIGEKTLVLGLGINY